MILVGHVTMLGAPASILRASRGFGYELSSDDAECSVLVASQLVPSGWGHPGLPGWGSVVDNTEATGPVELEELVFPPATPFGLR